MTVTTAPDDEGVDATLLAAVERLVRGGWDEFDSSLLAVGDPATVNNTRATVRLHFLRSDPNGRVRLDALARQLADQLVHYCIPRGKLAEVQELPADRQAPAITRMARTATKLFTQTQVQTGEGSELLLYVMLEKGLAIPQVLSKMSLKTNPEVHVHGSDGVHAKLLADGTLALYWGEAKMYDDVSSAMAEALDGIKPFLTGDAQAQDVFLIKHHADLGSEELTARLLEYFDDGSVRSAQVEMRGACLIGFSHSAYPQLPARLSEISAELQTTLTAWTKSIGTRVKNRGLETFELEVFLMPVPSAEDFRLAIRRELGLAPT